MFYSRKSNNLIYKIQKRSLRIISDDKESVFHTLRENQKHLTKKLANVNNRDLEMQVLCFLLESDFPTKPGIFITVLKKIRKMSKTPKNDLYFTQNFHSVGLCAVQKPVNWFWTDSLLILALLSAGREFWLNFCCFHKYNNHICYLLISFSVFFRWYYCTTVFISILYTRQLYYRCFTLTLNNE